MVEDKIDTLVDQAANRMILAVSVPLSLVLTEAEILPYMMRIRDILDELVTNVLQAHIDAQDQYYDLGDDD